MKHLKKFNEINEGKAMKAISSTNDVKKDEFRYLVKNFIKQYNDYKIEQIGNDFEVSNDNIEIQIMFRDNYIGVKTKDSKFTKEFKYNELGKVKSELKSIFKKKNK